MALLSSSWLWQLRGHPGKEMGRVLEECFLTGAALVVGWKERSSWSLGDETASGTGNEEFFRVVEDGFLKCIWEKYGWGSMVRVSYADV